ncbi:hypothetical protein [Pseudonocardia sp. N23]|uniref:hypothetical protein n=1 Tax=Pseudonocardia sp. N23 TaxID=1987376 RepID=UPI001145F9B0|nr:hypothetical protein [Pseudonocardia sp. N23]
MNAAEHALLALRRLGRRLLVLAVVLGSIGVGGVVAFVSVSFLMTPASVPGRCQPDPAAVPIDVAGPSGLTSEQQSNAAVIVATGRELAVPERGLWIALATALQESGLRNLDYGDRDSLGLFQQRPSQGWGTPDQVRQPRYAATQFFQRLLVVPAWTEMPLWQAAQAIQRSAFPTAYAKWEQAAADLLAEVGSSGSRFSTARTATCSGGGLPITASPAPLTGGSSGCIEDDPTTNGCVTTATRYALLEAERAFGGLRRGALIRSAGCHAQRPTNPTSDHPLGKGCDFFPGDAGRFAKGGDLDNGWRAAEWFRTNAEALQVSYVIWQGRIWTRGVADRNGWGRPYTGGGVYDASDPVGGHYDHLHVSFVR